MNPIREFPTTAYGSRWADLRNPGDLERRIRPKLNIESGDVEHPIR